MRKLLAIWTAKLLIIVGKLVGKKGSSTPGAVALKICPSLLKDLSSQVEKIIVTCGTNGKTTTNNLIADALGSCVCNRVGANMVPGVACAFVASSSIFGKIKKKYAVIEIDEFSAKLVFDHFKPDYMVITNLFRDQLDRYGEIDIAIKSLETAINKSEDCKLILNGDDPLVSAFGVGREAIYFGVEQYESSNEERIQDGMFCRVCGGKLEYEYINYSQLGKYSCPDCSFKHPAISYLAENINLDDGIKLSIGKNELSVDWHGFYNIYNIAAAFAACSQVEQDLNLQEVLNKYQTQIGRMQQFNINGKEVIFNLSKNPAGFNQAIETVNLDKRNKSAVIVINDNAQDGKDISWIWDVNFEKLQANKIFASGLRANDLEVRLKYAEQTSTRINNIELSIKEALNSNNPAVYVLVNYTALFQVERLLKKWSK